MVRDLCVWPGRGQHEALALFMGAIFDTPPENAAQVASDAAKILFAVGEQRAAR